MTPTQKLILSVAFSLLVVGCASSKSMFPSTDRSAGNTYVARKIDGAKGEIQDVKATQEDRKDQLKKVQDESQQHVTTYRNHLAQINGKLQAGTTPGNPDLMDQWRDARAELEKINDLSFNMDRLADDMESDRSVTTYIADTLQAAYKIQGATEENHKELRRLEEENRQTAADSRMLTQQIKGEANRQEAWVSKEKHNLNDLALHIKNGRIYGGGGYYGDSSSYGASSNFGASDWGNDDMGSTYGGDTMMDTSGIALPGRGRPLVAIGFGEKAPNYEQPLYQAVNRALERNPKAIFDVVAVSAQGAGVSAESHAEKVFKSLTDMGMPAARLRLSSMAADVTKDEVHVYER